MLIVPYQGLIKAKPLAIHHEDMQLSELVITTFDWVPQGPRGVVRDLRLRWVCEEAGLPYSVETIAFEDRETNHLDKQPFGQVPCGESDDGLVEQASGSDGARAQWQREAGARALHGGRPAHGGCPARAPGAATVQAPGDRGLCVAHSGAAGFPEGVCGSDGAFRAGGCLAQEWCWRGLTKGTVTFPWRIRELAIRNAW